MALINNGIGKTVIESPHYADDLHITGIKAKQSIAEAFFIKKSIDSICCSVTGCHYIYQKLTCPDSASYYEISKQAFMCFAVVRSIPFGTAKFER